MCEIVCSISHYNIINPELSRIRIHTIYPGPVSIPMICTHCSDVPCVKVCPEKALQYDDERAIIRLIKERCLGKRCSICARACKGLRSGVIRFYPPEHDYAIICDKCDGDPRCVKVCPTGCLKYEAKTLMPDGEYFADPIQAIAEDLEERWKPAYMGKRIKLPGE
ncbi:MAG: 4Fe-4S dicluster domain-containing protein [Nitrososphaerota archaeon]